jgi:superfamily I DNA/RNA helicase
MRRNWAIQSSDLTPEQQKAVQLEPKGSCAVYGPPGSGKTNVLLLRAKYLATKYPSRKILCLVFTSALKEFVKNGIKEYNLDASFVQTFHGWGMNCLKDFGIEIDDFDEVTPRLMALNKQGAIPKFDYLLVDEAQDFPKETIELFFQISDNVNLYFDKNQTIYQTLDKSEDKFPLSIRSFRQKFKSEVELPQNFRVPFKIAQLAATIMPLSKLDVNTRQDDRGDFPIYKAFKNEREELQFIKSRIDDIPNENPDYNFVILEKTNKENLEVSYKKLLDIGLKTETILFGFPKCDYETTIPKLMTLHSVKGLEFDVVFIIKATPLLFPGYVNDRSLAFVAITRAKSRVYITAERAISDVYYPPKKEEVINDVSLDDLFI